ncbi:MAG: TRAP transporter small permease [Candidatus Caldatribacteriota bacterium]|nr:TRAP transporter small permease [Candidatus Caldatribacteriota bacterium]
MRNFIDKINKCLNWASIISITVMLFIIFLQVIFRYVFHNSLTFSEELARYLFVWTVFLCSAVVARDNGHIIVGVLTERLKGKKARFIKIAAYISTMVFVSILFFQGLKMMKLSSFQHSPALGISMSWVYLAIPVATFVMFCNILISIVDVLQAKE